MQRSKLDRYVLQEFDIAQACPLQQQSSKKRVAVNCILASVLGDRSDTDHLWIVKLK
jgi:hypothetical protein